MEPGNEARIVTNFYSGSLYKKIDTEKLQCLNETEEGSGKSVFKPWDERADKTRVRKNSQTHLVSCPAPR